jgi:hypothetical protein
MRRRLLLLTVAVLLVGLWASAAAAAEGGHWPGVPLSKDFRGPGYYLSLPKIIACWVVFLFWVITTDWVSRDCLEVRFDYLRWNPIVFGSFMGAFILVWLIPYFWLGFILLLAAYAGPLTTYIVYRNARVEQNQRVLTKEHLRWLAASYLGKLGIKIAAEAPEAHAAGPPVTVRARGVEGPEANARLLRARQHLGLTAAREILADGMSCRASAIVLEYGQQGVAVRYMVDGVWLEREPLERDAADPALEALKTLCGLSPQDRQNRQHGQFGVDYSIVRPDVLRDLEAT